MHEQLSGAIVHNYDKFVNISQTKRSKVHIFYLIKN